MAQQLTHAWQGQVRLLPDLQACSVQWCFSGGNCLQLKGSVQIEEVLAVRWDGGLHFEWLDWLREAMIFRHQIRTCLKCFFDDAMGQYR